MRSVKGGGGLLPSFREVHLEVQLTGRAVLGRRDTGAGLGDVLVEEQGDELLVGGEDLAHAALGAAVSAVVDIDELDLVGGRGSALLEGNGGSEGEAADSGEEGAEEHCVCRGMLITSVGLSSWSE